MAVGASPRRLDTGARLRSGAVLVHFGMHKTGTSSIQESLFQRLSDPRFYYVNLGMANASKGISNGFKVRLLDYDTYRKLGLRASKSKLQRFREESTARLNAELSNTGTRIAILSGENISQLKETELSALRDFIAERGKSVMGAGYVRRPKEYMESAFQQRVRGGLQDFAPYQLFPNYRVRFEKFDTVLGRENVQLWLFDPASFPGHCVVQDFCSRLGIAFRAEDVIRANEGLSLSALSLLFAYRKFGPGFGVGPTVLLENKLLVTKVRALPGPKVRLHSSVVAPVIEARREEIAWMEERLGASLAEDVTAHDEGAIRTEEDLLKFSPEALRWLAAELGGDYLRHWHPGMNPGEVADWMHRLRLKLAAADERLQKLAVNSTGDNSTPINKVDPGGVTLKIDELVRSARQSAPGLAALAGDDAQNLVREVFMQVRQEIDTTAEGKVLVAGLGLFRIKRGEREKDGQKMSVKRIAFRAARLEAPAEMARNACVDVRERPSESEMSSRAS